MVPKKFKIIVIYVIAYNCTINILAYLKQGYIVRVTFMSFAPWLIQHNFMLIFRQIRSTRDGCGNLIYRFRDHCITDLKRPLLLKSFMRSLELCVILQHGFCFLQTQASCQEEPEAEGNQKKGKGNPGHWHRPAHSHRFSFTY